MPATKGFCKLGPNVFQVKDNSDGSELRGPSGKLLHRILPKLQLAPSVVSYSRSVVSLNTFLFLHMQESFSGKESPGPIFLQKNAFGNEVRRVGLPKIWGSIF